MKKLKLYVIAVCLLFLFTACSSGTDITQTQPVDTIEDDGIVDIALSDTQILVENEKISDNIDSDVYSANDIIYYEQGKDFTYGEGTEEEAHSAEEANSHTVVHITKAGEYRLSGKLSKGQIAVDLGKDAKDDHNAVVTLILSEADITCEVAPAVIFYNVYECGSDDADTATKNVDTASAGANVIIADGTRNIVNGSYVARIYEPESVVLSADGTEVEDASKLHKYDGAFYSRMSLNVNGGEKGTGILTINADNEGLDSELHLTINGGNININSGNDGINTNEDGVSVTTINGGTLNLRVTGETGEGDGIDSNGWLVINGGNVYAQACPLSADAGIDSDMGIHINGGTVVASGSMLDKIEDGGQNYVVFSFRDRQTGEDNLSLRTASGDTTAEFAIENDFSMFIYSSPKLMEGTYNLYRGNLKLVGSTGGMMGAPGGMRPDNTTPPEGLEEMTPPEKPQDMEPPQTGMKPPEGAEPPESLEPPQGDRPDWQGGYAQETSSDFEIKSGGNMFSNISAE